MVIGWATIHLVTERMDALQFGATQSMTDWAVSIQTAMAGLTLTLTGQRQATATKLTLSQTTQHNGVMKTAMATVATSVETMQMNVRMRQALPM